MDSWEDVLDYTFPVTPVPVSSAGAATAGYSAKNRAPEGVRPRFAVPDTVHPPGTSVMQRVRDAFTNGFDLIRERLPPPDVPQDLFNSHLRRLSMNIRNELLCHLSFYELVGIAKKLAEQILVAAGEPALIVDHFSPPLAFSQTGDENIGVTIGNNSSLFAVEMKKPAPLIVYGPKLAVAFNLDAKEAAYDEKAIAVRVRCCLELAGTLQKVA